MGTTKSVSHKKQIFMFSILVALFFVQGCASSTATLRMPSTNGTVVGASIQILGIVKQTGQDFVEVVVSAPDKLNVDKPAGKTVRVSLSKKTECETFTWDVSGVPSTSRIKVSNLRKGDMVTIEGIVSTTGYIRAERVSVSSLDKTNRTAGSEISASYNVNGTVSGLKADGFILVDESGKTVTVILNNETQVVMSVNNESPKPANAESIQSGDKVSVVGSGRSSGEVKAASVLCVK